MAEAAKVIDGEVEAPPKNGNGRGVARRKEAVPAPAADEGVNPMLAMIEQIIRDPTVSIERVNQAFDFYKRMDEDAARKAFNAAMADAKAEFTPIVKKRQVSFGEGQKATPYKHEDLGDIAEIVDKILGKYGLSYRYRGTSNPNEPVSVTCIVSHRQGYSEETTLHAGADGSGGKNSIQAIGSTVTYLQRYTLRLALGIATKRDDDGATANGVGETISEEQHKRLLATIKEIGGTREAALLAGTCKYMKVEKLTDLPAAKFADCVAALEIKRGA